MSSDKITHLKRVFVRVVRESSGLSEARCVPVADRLFAAMCEEFGPGRVWFPGPGALDREQLDAAIFEAFDGYNRRAVCRRFGISEATFYRSLARERGRRATSQRRSRGAHD